MIDKQEQLPLEHEQPPETADKETISADWQIITGFE